MLASAFAALLPRANVQRRCQRMPIGRKFQPSTLRSNFQQRHLVLDFIAMCANKLSGMSITGKVVVVTGASMGIGEAIVRRFLHEGASVVLCSRDLGRVEAARATHRCAGADPRRALRCDCAGARSKPCWLRLSNASDASMFG